MTIKSDESTKNPGLLITFEGPEGSGKSTLISSLAQWLTKGGIEPVLIREPGGSKIGERIRNILLDTASLGMCRETELLLMVASRAQLVREKILPALKEGSVILCDRFADASVAYQGSGRELGKHLVDEVNKVALAGLKPNLTILCMLPPEEGLARLQNRSTDRLDLETLDFHRRVYKGYQAMVMAEDPRFKVIDAAASADEMLAAAKKLLISVEHDLLNGF